MKSAKMSSFYLRIQAAARAGNEEQVGRLIQRGLNYYTDAMFRGIRPYATPDAGMISMCMRHAASELERTNPGAKELREILEQVCTNPAIQEKEVIERANLF